MFQIKCLKKLDNFVFSYDDVLFHNVESYVIIFLGNDMSFGTIYQNNVNSDGDNFDEEDLETSNNVRLMAKGNRLKQCKVCKKETSKELALLVRHQTR